MLIIVVDRTEKLISQIETEDFEKSGEFLEKMQNDPIYKMEITAKNERPFTIAQMVDEHDPELLETVNIIKITLDQWPGN